MDKQTLNLLMWCFTFILFIGFVLIYRNLNGKYIFSAKSKYEGLIIAVIGLGLSVITGVSSTQDGVETFKNLYV